MQALKPAFPNLNVRVIWLNEGGHRHYEKGYKVYGVSHYVVLNNGYCYAYWCNNRQVRVLGLLMKMVF